MKPTDSTLKQWRDKRLQRATKLHPEFDDGPPLDHQQSLPRHIVASPGLRPDALDFGLRPFQNTAAARENLAT